MFSSTPKHIVGIAISPNVGLEVILIDSRSRTVEKYGRRNIEYDSTKREVESYPTLKSSLIEIFNELSIPKKSNLYFVVPNIHFGFIDLPSELPAEEISSVLITKTESSYLFQKTQPLIAYADAHKVGTRDSKYLMYSAIQNSVLENLTDICTDLGHTLVGVEGSYSAIFRGIDYSGLAHEVIAGGQNWNVLLINNNSYAIFAMNGNNMFDYIEIPIAVKSIGYEEAYRSLAASVVENLPNYPSKNLIILSQNDDISAGVLKTQMTFEGEIDTLDCNKYAKNSIVRTGPFIDAEEGKHISPSAIGAATAGVSQMGFELNIFGANKRREASGGYAGSGIRFGLVGSEIVITPDIMSKLMYGIGIVFFLIATAAYVGLDMWKKNLTTSVDSLKTEKSNIQMQIDEMSLEGKGIDINAVITELISNNKKMISYYDSLSLDIPKNTWLTYFYAREGGNVAVEGLSLGINGIYEYFKGIKNSIPTSSVRLTKLRALTDILDSTYDPKAKGEAKIYEFEISNTASKKNGGGIAAADAQPAGEATGEPSDLEPIMMGD